MFINIHDADGSCLINVNHIVMVGMTMPFYPENDKKVCTIICSNGNRIYPEESVEECAKIIRLMNENRR